MPDDFAKRVAESGVPINFVGLHAAIVNEAVFSAQMMLVRMQYQFAEDNANAQAHKMEMDAANAEFEFQRNFYRKNLADATR